MDINNGDDIDMDYTFDYDKLYEAMRKQNIKISELARELNIVYSSMYHQVGYRNLKLDTMINICLLLNLDMNKMIIPRVNAWWLDNEEDYEEGEE